MVGKKNIFLMQNIDLCAKELGQYIDVDIYGGCGSLKCARNNNANCLDMLDSEYKFYLAFENSNCQDYITEKFWSILNHDVIPIVMGPTWENYKELGKKR